MIEALGAHAVVADAFDAEALRRAVAAAEPEVVIHQLTDLPDVSDPVADGRGARAQFAAADRGHAQSDGGGEGRGRPARDRAEHRFRLCGGVEASSEDDPLDATRRPSHDHAGVIALEEAVLDTPGIEGIVLRYGRLYGPGTWFDKPGGPGPLTAGAAAQAALLAVTRGAPGIYNIAEDDGEFSIEKARHELGFDPDFRLSA